MQVLIIFILIVALVLCRIQTARFEEGFDGQTGPIDTIGVTGLTGPIGTTGPMSLVSEPVEPAPFIQTPVYDGVW